MDFPNSRLTNCFPDFQFQTWEASLMLQKHETDNTFHKTPKLHTYWSVDLDCNTADTDLMFNHRGCHPEQKRTSSLALRVVHCAQEIMLCMYCLQFVDVCTSYIVQTSKSGGGIVATSFVSNYSLRRKLPSAINRFFSILNYPSPKYYQRKKPI